MNDLPKDTAEGRQTDLEVGASSSSASQIPVAPGQLQDTVEFSVVVQEVTSSIDDMQKRLLMVQTSIVIYTRVIGATNMNDMKINMDRHLDGIRTTAGEVRGKLEALERSNAANRKIMNSQAGSSTDRARIGVTSDLKKRLREFAIATEGLGKTFQDRYRRVVQFRVFVVNGKEADESVITRLIETGDSHQIFQNPIVAPERVALAAITEIQGRHAAFQDFKTRLLEIHQIFLDMGIFVEPQGEPVDNIEPEVIPELHPEVVPEVVPQVDQRVDHANNCICIFLIFCILVVFFIVLALVVKPWEKAPK